MEKSPNVRRKNSFSSLYTIEQPEFISQLHHVKYEETESVLEHTHIFNTELKDRNSSRSHVLSDSDVSNDLTLTGEHTHLKRAFSSNDSTANLKRAVSMQKDVSVASYLDSKDGQEKMREIMQVIMQDEFVSVDGSSSSAAEAFDTMLDRLESVWTMRISEIASL